MARWMRDVWVNIVANLAAAAIVYLVGAALGLFPRTATALATAFAVTVLIIMFVPSGVVYTWALVKSEDGHDTWPVRLTFVLAFPAPIPVLRQRRGCPESDPRERCDRVGPHPRGGLCHSTSGHTDVAESEAPPCSPLSPPPPGHTRTPSTRGWTIAQPSSAPSSGPGGVIRPATGPRTLAGPTPVAARDQDANVAAATSATLLRPATPPASREEGRGLDALFKEG